MSNEFSLARPFAGGPSPARRALDELMARIGVDGLTAAYANPGLLARVDQHAADVRQALRRTRRRMDVTALARYAHAVVAGAHRAGRSVPAPGRGAEVDWPAAEWHLIRLLAVCALADERGLLRPPR